LNNTFTCLVDSKHAVTLELQLSQGKVLMGNQVYKKMWNLYIAVRSNWHICQLDEVSNYMMPPTIGLSLVKATIRKEKKDMRVFVCIRS